MTSTAHVTLLPMVRAVRVFVEHGPITRRACTIAVGRVDGSLYVIPNRGRGYRYRAGLSFFSPNRGTATFDSSEVPEYEGTPRISIHPTGQVHITLGGQGRIGPLWLPRLSESGRVHVATILPNSMEALPPFAGDVASKVANLEHAWLVRADATEPNCRIAVHINAVPEFPDGYLVRGFSGLLWGSPLFIGLAVRENQPLISSGKLGVTLLAGMDPFADLGAYQHFLWVTSRPMLDESSPYPSQDSA